MKRRGLIGILMVLCLMQIQLVFADVNFVNKSSSFGQINNVHSYGGKLIGYSQTGDIIISTDKGLTWENINLGITNYHAMVVKDQTMLFFNPTYEQEIAIYTAGKWAYYDSGKKILGIGSNKNGFTMIHEGGKILVSSTGAKGTWNSIGEGVFTTGIREMYYLEESGFWVVLGNDHKLYSTKDFKTKKDLGYTGVSDLEVAQNKVYFISSKDYIVQLDSFLNEVYKNTDKIAVEVSKKGSYNALTIVKGEPIGVGNQGGIINKEKKLIGTIDRKFYPFVQGLCSDGDYLYTTDQANGIIRYNMQNESTMALTGAGQKYQLVWAEGKIFTYHPGAADQYIYLLNTNGSLTSLTQGENEFADPEGIFKRGNEYVLRNHRGGELRSADLKNWTYTEERYIYDKDREKTSSTENSTTVEKELLVMENIVKVGEVLYFITEKETGEKIGTAITGILDTKPEGSQKIIWNQVDLDKQTDKLVMVPDQGGETTLQIGLLQIGTIQSITPFKNNQLIIGGQNGNIVILEQKKVNNNIELTYKAKYQLPEKNYGVDCVKIYNNKIYVAINRSVYWSSDGSKWNKSTLPNTVHGGEIIDFAYGNGTYMIITQSDAIAYTTDLKEWKVAPLNKQRQLEQLEFTGEKFVITTFDGGLLVSDPVKPVLKK